MAAKWIRQANYGDNNKMVKHDVVVEDVVEDVVDHEVHVDLEEEE